ncbi:potassium channel family protein [Georgenia sp. SUBG003]|uniref:potassium channel family protein n=1 Tax=Georgenia sp. SUBG003 TaxID=1497974 RepID=UPI003AB7CD60
MTGPSAPSRRSRRRLRRLALLRPVLTAVLVVAVYYLWPAGPPRAQASWLSLVVMLAALAALLAWQVRAVATSSEPRLRGIEALATVIPLFVVLFAGFYLGLAAYDPGAFTEDLGRTDALYFAVTTLATVGFGDIAAQSEAARIAVTVQMVSGLVLLGVGVKVVLGAAELGLRRTGRPEGWLPLPGGRARDDAGTRADVDRRPGRHDPGGNSRTGDGGAT